MYSYKIEELKKITDERLLAIAAELPSSPDGKPAVYETRYELRGREGELLSDASKDCTFFGELALSVEGLDNDCEMVFSFSVALEGGEYDEAILCDAIAATEEDIRKFFGELNGNSHGEYFEALAKERAAQLMPEDKSTPFDYVGFMIKASVTVVVILAAFFAAQLIPKLLG